MTLTQVNAEAKVARRRAWASGLGQRWGVRCVSGGIGHRGPGRKGCMRVPIPGAAGKMGEAIVPSSGAEARVQAASTAASRGWGPGQADGSLGGASWPSQTPEGGEHLGSGVVGRRPEERRGL